jgi:hypothetical protein
VSQVTVALYVFFKWWSGEKRLLGVAALLFVSGIIKFGQKPWALRRASFNSMLDLVSIDPRRREVAHPGASACWILCVSSLGEKDLPRGLAAAEAEAEQEGLDISLEQYVKQAKECVQDRTVRSDDQDLEDDPQASVEGYRTMLKIFFDMSATYSQRLANLKYWLTVDDKFAYYPLQVLLDHAFRMLYTKQRIMDIGILAYCIWYVLLPFLSLASLVLFAKSHKDGYSEKDVRVTYILLSCNAVLEFLPYLYSALSSLLPWFESCWRYTTVAFFMLCLCTTRDRVSRDRIFQYSLMSSVARTKKPTILMELATLNCVRGYINKHWYIGEIVASTHITRLLLGYMEDGWKEYISDAASYRRFSNLRGQWTLRRLGLEQQQRQGVAWSFKMAFDRSVLLWHIATDLCFHHPNTSPRGRDTNATPMQRGREISNYMIYLLFIRPEMLMPGTRPGLFDHASYVLEEAFKDSKAPLHSEERLALEIMDMVKSSATAPGHLVRGACRLADALMELDDEGRRWQLIQGVWVEMLCYSAARCRGYLHAKSLGDGVEYLSYVWLLWSFMGMETLADRSQKPEEPPQGEEEIAPTRASAFQSNSNQTEQEISSLV